MISPKIQNVKTELKISKCQNIILSKKLKSLDGYSLRAFYQNIIISDFDILTFWLLNQFHSDFQLSRQNVAQAHYYVMGAYHSFAPIYVTGFPLLGKLDNARLSNSFKNLHERKKTMQTKTVKDFIHENKSKEAIFTISLDHHFAWAMMTDEGHVGTSSNKDLDFSDSDLFPAYCEAVLLELHTMKKLTSKIDGIMVRLPKLVPNDLENSLKKMAVVSVIKLFCLNNKIKISFMAPGEINEAAFHEARRILKDHEKHKSEISALEVLFTITCDPEEDDEAEDDEEDSKNININIHMGRC